MARIHDIVVDCAHPASVARFWAAALDGYEVAPYDAAELERLRGMGIEDPEDNPTVLVEAGPGVRPRFFFQRVPEGKFRELRTDACFVEPPPGPAIDAASEANRARLHFRLANGF